MTIERFSGDFVKMDGTHSDVYERPIRDSRCTCHWSNVLYWELSERVTEGCPIHDVKAVSPTPRRPWWRRFWPQPHAERDAQ